MNGSSACEHCYPYHKTETLLDKKTPAVAEGLYMGSMCHNRLVRTPPPPPQLILQPGQ
ncbi:hypothetical protein J6590_019494 [Homalodisca vitripennis]|nr:hypothetical protein J6590_019494 [Homalodisca vitripennis]